MDEQFLVEDYQTNAGVIETVDASDDEVRASTVLIFFYMKMSSYEKWRTDKIWQPASYLICGSPHAELAR